MTRTISRGRLGLLAVLVMAAAFTIRPSAAFPPSGSPVFDGGPTNYITVSDGTSIAVNVVVPKKCDPVAAAAEGFQVQACPAILEMAGYENGSSDKSGRTTIGQLEDWCKSDLDPNGSASPNCPAFPLTGDSHDGTSAIEYDADYVLVHASVRGTGCSSGTFDLFSERSSMDGYEIIENWIVDDSKHATSSSTNLSTFVSNGKVGILGHSYSGITGFLVAAQEGKAARDNDPNTTNHLEAVTVSGLIDDLYRGITYPGGVANMLFPPEWTLGVRPAYDVLGGSLQGIFRNADDHPEIAAQCAQNIATHNRTVIEDPIVNGIWDTDSNWWRSRALVTYAPFIADPIHMSGAFQDEQTGPRFPHLFEVVPNEVPKRLLMSNGDHGTQVSGADWPDRKAWVDYWMLGAGPAPLQTSVRTLIQLHGDTPNAIKDSTSFPLEDTTWTPYYLCGGNTLTNIACTTDGSAPYLSGSKRQSWFRETGETFGSPITTKQAPDELNFLSAPLPNDTLIDGPILVNLFAQSTANDTEFMVQIADRYPDGTVAILQRGLLKASHRAVDLLRSDYDEAHGNFMYRPFHPHTNPTDIVPGATNEYQIEIFPVAWPFRAGHQIQIKIMAPTAVDNYYSYAPKTMPLALNTVLFGGSNPSRITLPVVPWVSLASEHVCTWYVRIRCVKDN